MCIKKYQKIFDDIQRVRRTEMSKLWENNLLTTALSTQEAFNQSVELDKQGARLDKEDRQMETEETEMMNLDETFNSIAEDKEATVLSIVSM